MPASRVSLHHRSSNLSRVSDSELSQYEPRHSREPSVMMPASPPIVDEPSPFYPPVHRSESSQPADERQGDIMSEIDNAIQAAKAAEVPRNNNNNTAAAAPPPPSSSDAQSSYSQDVQPVKPPSLSVSDALSTYSQDQDQRSFVSQQQVHKSGEPSPQLQQQQPTAVFPPSSSSSQSELVESQPPPLPAGAESPTRQHTHSRTASYESRDISTPLQSPSLFSECSRRNPDNSSVQTPTSPALSPTSQFQAQSQTAQNKRASRRQSSYTAREPSIKLSVRPPSMASKPGTTAAYSTMSRDHELRQKARAGPPPCASWTDIAQKKTAGQRAMAYAHKINALGRESSGLALWIEMQRHQQDRSELWVLF